MCVRIQIPANLRPHVAGLTEVEVQGGSVFVALDALCQAYPEVREYLFRNPRQLQPHLNVFVQGQSIRDLAGLDTPLTPDTAVLIVPALAGG